MPIWARQWLLRKYVEAGHYTPANETPFECGPTPIVARHCMLAGLASTQLTSKSGSTPSTYQRNAIRMVFHLWADNGLGLNAGRASEQEQRVFFPLCALLNFHTS